MPARPKKNTRKWVVNTTIVEKEVKYALNVDIVTWK